MQCLCICSPCRGRNGAAAAGNSHNKFLFAAMDRGEHMRQGSYRLARVDAQFRRTYERVMP